MITDILAYSAMFACISHTFAQPVQISGTSSLPSVPTSKSRTTLKRYALWSDSSFASPVFENGAIYSPDATVVSTKVEHRDEAVQKLFTPVLLAPLPTVATVAPAKAHAPAVAPKLVAKNPEDALCSINISGAKLNDILSRLTDRTPVNLLLLAPSDTTLTVRLSNLRLIDMLHHICAMTNMAYLKVGNAFAIATEDKLKAGYPTEWLAAHPADSVKLQAADEIVTDFYPTSYLDASLLVDSLKLLYTDPRMVILSAPSQLTPAVVGQDKAATGAQQTVIVKEQSRTSRTIMLRGPRGMVQNALADAARMDTPKKQVRIAVTIHDVSNDNLRELGLEWTLPNLSIQEQSDANNVGVAKSGNFTRAPLNFFAAVKALETHNQAKLLASPDISVLDNEPAFILIGSRLTFPVLIGYTQANTPIFDKQEERVGIYLQVKAVVSNDNHITLALYPQVSTVTGFINVNGAEYPQISTREAQTTLDVPSGQTIVVGGLLKSEDIVDIQKLPILGNIPILGEFFTRRRKTRSSSQVIITLTPTILSDKR